MVRGAAGCSCWLRPGGLLHAGAAELQAVNKANKGRSAMPLQALLVCTLIAPIATAAPQHPQQQHEGAVGIGGAAVTAANSSNCTCIPSAKDADLISALSWVCGPGKVDCSAINPGGSHFNPNDAVDHANYAFNAFYQAHKSDGFETCFFGGNAYVKPPPAGHYLFVQGGALDYPYPEAKEGMGLWDTINAGQQAAYISQPFSGTFHAGSGGFASSVFSLWLAGTSAGVSAHVEITYHLPCTSRGDGGLPSYRREWYLPMVLSVAPKYDAYTNAIGFAEAPVGTFCSATGIIIVRRRTLCPSTPPPPHPTKPAARERSLRVHVHLCASARDACAIV